MKPLFLLLRSTPALLLAQAPDPNGSQEELARFMVESFSSAWQAAAEGCRFTRTR